MLETLNRDAERVGISAEVLKLYRAKRRDGYEDGRPIPARWALNWARAVRKGHALWMDGDPDDEDRSGMTFLLITREVSELVKVEVRYVWDDSGCDCWHDWEEGDPDIPDHNHFGIVARVVVDGEPCPVEQGMTSMREGEWVTTTYQSPDDSCWGFYVEDYGSDDFCVELVAAWEHVAHMIDAAHKIDAGLSEYTRQMILAHH